MAEELQHEDLAQGQGPPELVIKLALQYLTWKEELHRHSCLLSVSTVCKKWKQLLETDEVGRPLCLNLLKSYDDLIAIRNKNGRARAEERGEDFQDEVYYYKSHELLARLMKTGPPRGRSYKDLFEVSIRIGEAMDTHGFDGPDVPQRPSLESDARSLREASIQDYRWILRPTIERLRHVFDNNDCDDNSKKERLKDVAEMRKRLLHHARGDGRTILLRKNANIWRRRSWPKLPEGQCLRWLHPRIWTIECSFENIIEGLETIKGSEIAVQLSLQLKKTTAGAKRKFIYLPSKSEKKLLGMRIDELCWPVNPVDLMNFLLRKIFPNKDLVIWDDDDDFDASEESQEKRWCDVVSKYWLEASEPIRQLIVTVYNNEVATRFSDADSLPVDTPTSEVVPLDALKLIFGLPYTYFREKVANKIWRDIEPSLRHQIFEMYHRQTETFCEAIQEEYQSVYSETCSLEYNAKLLLDIFLDVPLRHDDRPRFPGSLTAEACDTFVERMEEAMNRWNELIDLSKTDDEVLWDPQTIAELESFDLMFGHTRSRERQCTLEFCVPQMVTEFLYRNLSHEQEIPKREEFTKAVEKFGADYIRSNAMTLSYSESVERDNRAMCLVNDFRALSSHIYERHHAMIALLPLLPHLSVHDCKRLVNALFIQRDVHHRNKWESSRCAFSNYEFRDLDIRFINKIPCARGDDTAADLILLLKWHQERNVDLDNSYEIFDYILGVPLPENIISSMGEFMVENLYQGNLNNVNKTKTSNVRRVTLFLRRFCYERPERAHIVWDYMREAIQNAIAVVEGVPEIELGPVQRANWIEVIYLLVIRCVEISAKRLLSHLRRLYQGTPLALLPENFVGFRTLAERIKQPLIFNDTLYYHYFQEHEL